MRLLSGMDMVDVGEVSRLLEEKGEAFIQANFTAGEREYCESRKKMRHEHYAGRIAVKRAFFKAVGKKENEFPLNEIEVTRERGHVPCLHISESLRSKAGLLPQDKVLVSLAHERKLAVGTVVIVKDAE